jgi:Saccharopine dehydrogenase NADP binding domain
MKKRSPILLEAVALTVISLLASHRPLDASLIMSARTTKSRISLKQLKGKNVLVVGGSGRVGGSVTTQLAKNGSKVTVGGTDFDSFIKSKRRWLQLFPDNWQEITDNVDFACVDREHANSINAVLTKTRYDLVVHTAGPFQGKVNAPNGVLEAALAHTVPYIDVCDDYCTATAAKAKLAAQAVDSGTPCILSTGCWPGVSSLMAKQLISSTLENYPNLQPKDLSVNFSFFTAGSGGAGVTLLVATFLILAEKALTVVKGRHVPVDAMKTYRRIHFGDVVGDRHVAHLNLLETASVHDVLGVGSTQSRFGTAPDFWNTLLGLMAKLPPEILSNEDLMRKLSVFSIPLVRLVDAFAGATNAMRCDVTCGLSSTPELHATAIYAHENLESCVGECVVAFCAAILTKGTVPSGIWFPEEAIRAGEDAASVLQLASRGAHTTEVASIGLVNLTKERVWGPSQRSVVAVIE